MLPKSKPQAAQDKILKLIKDIDRKKYPCVLVGIRGYYLDTLGVKGKNDRGLFDDAAFWLTPSGFVSYNFNTDPSSYRKGRGVGEQKGMALLKPGVWLYQMGLHKNYQAFRQAEKVIVIRDGEPDYEDKGWFGINIHRGGVNTTSSLGCQTLPPSQWDSFKSFGYSELKRYKQNIFPYVLLEEKNLRG